MLSYVLLVIGFALLIKGADFFVDGSSRIATKLKVSPMLIGLTIVAFGTSSPEATVSIIAALNGSADVALGNALGSNMFNITLVIGLTAIILPMKVENETIRKEIPFTLLASVALLVMLSDLALQPGDAAVNQLSRADGIILLLFFAIFMYYVFEIARNNRESAEASELPGLASAEEEAAKKKGGDKWGKNIALTLGGLAGIILGGDFVVRGAVDIALSLGMSETLVGLTIVAVGTSLPELVTSVAAAIKKQSDIALGNIVGSNIFNILFVLGAASVITPLRVDPKIFTDLIIMIAFMVVLLIFSRTHYQIKKGEGIILTLSYIAYIVFVIIRN